MWSALFEHILLLFEVFITNNFLKLQKLVFPQALKYLQGFIFFFLKKQYSYYLYISEIILAG